MAEVQENRERVLLAGVELSGDMDFERSMKELKSLAEACNMEVLGMLTQKMEMTNKALYLGTGKIEELKEFSDNTGADVIVFEDALSPSQLRNLQQILKKPILDRTTLILEIFSTRAQTREAKLQVETAKLQYLLPRLVGLHEALSRQGGGSGLSNKGSGEKKLELDRRKIEHRIAELRRELEVIARERETQRKKRMASSVPLVALVGYTNAGKSTLMNHMIDHYVQDDAKKVLEKDMLFATLETTVRKIAVPDQRSFLISDTVGFIHKLPTFLVKAFRSTLEEIKNADLLLHVVDYSDPDYKKQIEVTEQTLIDLGASDIPVVYIFNKADMCIKDFPKVQGNNKIFMAAGKDKGIEELVDLISLRLCEEDKEAEFLIPYDKGQISSYLIEHAVVKETEYAENGIRMQVICSKADYSRYQMYLC